MISNLLANVRSRLATTAGRRLETRRIARELNDSSDRVLADLGIARGDISAVATGRFAGA